MAGDSVVGLGRADWLLFSTYLNQMFADGPV